VTPRQSLRHVSFMLGATLTGLLLMTAALSHVYTPEDPLAMSIAGRLAGPSWSHPFGTDQYGRDILSRVMLGTRTSIAVGVIAVGIGATMGMVIGVLSGYVGGWVDEVSMRLVDAVQGFPAILSALLFAAVFAPGLVVGMTAIGIAFVPAFARLTRSGFLEFREREFVLAARALGAGDLRLVCRHILPNALPPLIIQATTAFPVAILAEAGLAYLGLGTQPPYPSWGLMLKEAQNFLSLSPSYAVFPGGAIALTVLGLNLLGDGLRDLLDPRTT
jgi:peptide/nickel transport system permease protein